MGLRAALASALETDIYIETAGGPERAEFNRIRREQGLKAALAWRDAKFTA
jgi:enoyl-CoA hydratase